MREVPSSPQPHRWDERDRRLGLLQADFARTHWPAPPPLLSAVAA
jgi:hypothetical protein